MSRSLCAQSVLNVLPLVLSLYACLVAALFCSVVKMRALSRVQYLRRARVSESLSSANTYALYRAQCAQERPSLHVVVYQRIVFRA